MSDQASPHFGTVERLVVQVLVDNVSDQLSTQPEFVKSERECLIEAGMAEWSGETICCAHFGLSLMLTVHRNGSTRTLLFDAGPEGYAVHRNGERLGTDFGAVEAVVLSHGHWDHAGGMNRAMEMIQEAKGGQTVPWYGHPDMFLQRGVRRPNGEVLAFAPIPSPQDLTTRGAEVRCSAEPQTLLDGLFYLSGEIPRVIPYEQGLPNHLRRTAPEAEWEPDPLIMDEQFVAVNVEDKGLVVFTACSHAGVINVLTETRNAFPEIPIHAVIGGFHLSGPGPEKIIPETVADLSRFDLRWIIPCHCTGYRAVAALLNDFGEDKVVPGAVGKRFTF